MEAIAVPAVSFWLSGPDGWSWAEQYVDSPIWRKQCQIDKVQEKIRHDRSLIAEEQRKVVSAHIHDV